MKKININDFIENNLSFFYQIKFDNFVLKKIYMRVIY